MPSVAREKVEGAAAGSLREGRFVYYLIFGAPAAAMALLWTIAEVTDSLKPLVLSGFRVTQMDATKGTYVADVSYALPALIVILAYLAMAGFGYAVKMKIKDAEVAAARTRIRSLEAAGRAAQDVETKARNEVAGTTLAVDQIVNRLYEIDRPRWRFTKVVGRYCVQADGSADVEMLYHIEAATNPAQVWKFDIAADESAQPIEWLDEIKLRIESLDLLDGKDVRFLLFRDSPRGKKIAIFFLPEIVAGEERKVRITYSWPRLAGDLVTKGKTIFEHSFRTCDPADCADVSYTYLFAPELGHLDIHPLSNLGAADQTTRVPGPGTMTGWTYSNPRLSMEGRKIAFAVAKVSATSA